MATRKQTALFSNTEMNVIRRARPGRPAVVPHPRLASAADRDLLKFVRDYRKGALGREQPHGRCAMVCYGLEGILSALRGIQTEVAEIWLAFPSEPGRTYGHVYLRREDGTIIDPTGDQFNDKGVNMPPVYIGPMPEAFVKWQVPEPPDEKPVSNRAKGRKPPLKLKH